MAAVIQRPLRGSRISSFYPVKSLPSLSSLDSAFQLQEYISLLIRLDVHDVDAIVSIPGKGQNVEKNGKEKESETNESDAKKDEKEGEKDKKSEVTVDEACWIYEQLRRLAQDLSHPLITMLQQECTRSSCPEMKAGEWLYLCVAHGNDGAMEQCCAIDYILHTIDSATALLNSPRAFPSRLQIPQTSHRHFSSLARRLGRIFAHAYFHHREAFEQAEAESSLYARFLALTSKFDLVPVEFLVIPPRIIHDPNDERRDRDLDVPPPTLQAAAVDPLREQERDRHSRDQLAPVDLDSNEWSRGDMNSIERSKSKSPPGSGSESPRKVGRNRTDTMVFSEAYAVAEELAKSYDSASSPSSNAPSETAAQGSPSQEPPNTDVVSEASVDAPAPPSSTVSAPEPTPTEGAIDELEVAPAVTPSSSTAPAEPVPDITPETDSGSTVDTAQTEPVVEVIPVDETETGGHSEDAIEAPAQTIVEAEEKLENAEIAPPQESSGESSNSDIEESPAPQDDAPASIETEAAKPEVETAAAVPAEVESSLATAAPTDENKSDPVVATETPQPIPNVEVDVATETEKPKEEEHAADGASEEKPTESEPDVASTSTEPEGSTDDQSAA